MQLPLQQQQRLAEGGLPERLPEPQGLPRLRCQWLHWAPSAQLQPRAHSGQPGTEPVGPAGPAGPAEQGLRLRLRLRLAGHRQR
jgi:hypothetical protein